MTDQLESSLEFLMQSNRRLYDAEKVEAMVKRLRSPHSVVDSAEKATRVAALTFDESVREFAEQVRDEIKTTVIAAVAAMQEPKARMLA